MELTSHNISAFDILRQRMNMPAAKIELPAEANRKNNPMIETLSKHWPEYLMEAAELGLFMISACAFTVLLYHPASPIIQLIQEEVIRRVFMGVAMGTTAIAIIFSPLGKRSGAHFNPAVTLTFFRLGKIRAWDAGFYAVFQFCGGVVGVALASFLLRDTIAHESVKYAATVPGPAGPLGAFVAEVTITFVLMSVILTVSNTRKLARWTGLFAGAMVATYISIESPISGMSMNPARTFGSASVGNIWTSLWIYFTAPPLGMLLAAEIYSRLKPDRAVVCAKLHHHNDERCIFNCNFQG